MIDPGAYPGRVAAAAPRIALDFARDRAGEAAARRIAEEVAADGFDLARVDRDAWIPFATHLALVERIDARLGAGDDPSESDVLWDLGVHNARNAHRFVPGLGALLAFVKPARLVSSAPAVWRTYADFGEVRGEASRAGGRLALSGFRPHAAFCGTLGGFFAGLLTRVGAHACAVEHTECMLRGAPACTFTGTWT